MKPWAVRSIDSPSHQITLATPSVYGLKTGARFFAFECPFRKKLDQAGEYYIDRDASVLYFWPPAPLAGNRVTFVAALNPSCFATGHGLRHSSEASQ